MHRINEERFYFEDTPDSKSFTDTLSREHYTRDKTFKARHLKLELSFDELAKKVMGRMTLTLSPINDHFQLVELDSVDLTIKQVVDQEGKTLAFMTSEDKLLINLKRSYQSGDLVIISVDYEGIPKKGLFFVQPDQAYPHKPYQIWSQGEAQDNSHWFPCYDAPNDKCTSEVFLTVQEKYLGLSNGKLIQVSHDSANKTRTFHWLHEIPHTTYLVNIAVGEFSEVTEYYEDIPITYYVPRGDEEKIQRSFENTPDMMKFFSEKTGYRYPYAKYGQVTVYDFTWGGMENTSLTILTHVTLHDTRAHSDYKSEALVAHELAHQWFGDLLTTKSWEHLWLNEGFASYFDPLYFEHKWGVDEFHNRMIEEAEGYFKEAEKYKRPIVTNFYTEHEDMFDAHSYNKAAWVLHMLRYVLSDNLFWKVIPPYVQKFAGKNVETGDLKVTIEEVTGLSLEWFFKQWFYKAGHPEFEVKWGWEPVKSPEPEERGMVVLTIKQAQKTDEQVPIFRMPVEIEITTKEKSEVHKVTVEKVEQTFFFPSDSKPLMVLFDPNNWILKTLKFDKPKDEWLYQVKHGKSIAMRIQACEGLGKILNDAKVVVSLKEVLLGDPFYSVRQAAATALGEIGTDDALTPLLDGLKDKDSRVRRGVVEALGKFKKESVLITLRQVFENDESYFAVGGSLKSAAKTKLNGVYDFVLEGLKRDSWAEVIRASVFNALGELKDPRGVEVAMKHTSYGQPYQVRMAAVRALGKLGDSLDDKKEAIREHLVPLLKDPHHRVRRTVIDALATLGDRKAIPELEKLADSEPLSLIKRASQKAIKAVQEKAGEKSLKVEFQKDLESLRDENKDLKKKLEELAAKVAALVGTGEPNATINK
jgi:aminopeptidase N